MALELCYFSGHDPITRLVYGHIVGSDTVTLSTSSTQSNTAAPANVAVVRIRAGENCRVTVGAAPTAVPTNTCYLGAGETIDKQISPGHFVAGYTV